jgi:hypothetical protein
VDVPGSLAVGNVVMDSHNRRKLPWGRSARLAASNKNRTLPYESSGILQLP